MKRILLAVVGLLLARAALAQDIPTVTSGASTAAPITLSKDGIAVTSTDAAILSNATAAANGAQQWSPRLHFIGSGWKTSGTPGAQTFDFIGELQTFQGVGASNDAQAALMFSIQTAGGGYKKAFGFFNNSANGYPDSGPLRNDGVFAVYNTNTPSDFATMQSHQATGNSVGAAFGTVTTGGSGWAGMFVQASSGNTNFFVTSDPDPFSTVARTLRIDNGSTTASTFTIRTAVASSADTALHQPLVISAGTAATVANKSGKDLTLQGGQSTGTGTGGSIFFQTTPVTGSASTGTAYTTNLQIYPGIPFRVNVGAGDFTTAANTNLQAITGLAWTFPSNVAATVHFDCYGVYSIATAAVAVDFGVQDVTVAPTNAILSGSQWIATGSAAPTIGVQTGFATTTATSVTTATPGLTATKYPWELHGFIEQPSNASTSVFQIMVKTAVGGDAVTVYRGSFCTVF